jgi:UDP-3-O-[3-hydroxymyristoyl] glucosamine N-acyltransferase
LRPANRLECNLIAGIPVNSCDRRSRVSLIDGKARPVTGFGFFQTLRPVSVADIATRTSARVATEGGDGDALIYGVASIADAHPGDLTFYDNKCYADALARCRATACFLREADLELLPRGVIGLVADRPHQAMTETLAGLFPETMEPSSLFGAAGVSPSAIVHPEARLEPGVIVDPGASIGPHAEIGSETVIGSHAVIGPHVKIGRGCRIGPHVSVTHSYIGNRVIIHPGARLGQDGFGFTPTHKGHMKAPQLARVIVQDDVEIGANTTIDRGALCDTIIGEGSKIDNLVQIGHNVTVGRGCLIAAQAGIAGSCQIGDFAQIGGQAAIAGRITIGEGAGVAAKSGVMRDIPPFARYGGAPARPLRRFLRGEALLARLSGRISDKNGNKK